MSNSVETVINEVISLINQNELNLAKLKTEKFISQNKHNDVLYNLLGIIYLKLKLHIPAIENFKKAIKINNNFISALINLAIAYQEIGEIDTAINIYQKVLNINPDLYLVLNDLALLFKKKNEIDTAIEYFNKCIKINPRYDNAYYNLGIIYKKLKDNDKAIIILKEGKKINPNNQNIIFELAEINRTNKNFDKAIKLYNISKHEKSSYKKLQCLFEGGFKDKYNNELKIINKKNPNDRRIASLAAFVSEKLKIENTYSFCPNPLNYIYKSSIEKYFDDKNIFINKLLNEISAQNFNWEPSGRTTVNGFTTTDLSEKKLPNITKLERIIFDELKLYYNFFRNEKINLIENKPKNYKIVSWSNRLKKEGYNTPHIHPSGWVSGVFYLKVPSKINDDEGGIKFHLNGDDFINNNQLPTKTIHPKVGDFVLFPSSLFHSTIPFNSNEERVCIAFDLCNLN